MRVLHDPSAGEWIRPRLQGWGIVGGTVPRGYPAVARVLHPADLTRFVREGTNGIEVETRAVTWREVAAHFGRTAHAAMQWGSLTGARDGQLSWGEGWLLNPPQEGRLERTTFTALMRLLEREGGSGRWIAGLWNGWGELRGDGTPYVEYRPTDSILSRLRAPRRGRAGPLARDAAAADAAGLLLRLPNRDHVLMDAQPEELTSHPWFAGLGSEEPPMPASLTPNLLWPDDRAWCLATEIDFDSTLVAGDRRLIDALLASDDLEVVEVTDDTDLSWTGDEVNPPPS